jgi:KilA-N domain
MATASGKRLSSWTQLDKANSYLQTLSAITGIPVINLLVVGEGNQPTWGHPKVALRFAQWCSDELAVQVDTWIDELLTTGSVSIAPKTPLELAKEQVRLHEQLELQAAQITIHRLSESPSTIKLTRSNSIGDNSKQLA